MKKIFCFLLLLALPVMAFADDGPASKLSDKQLKTIANFSKLTAAKSLKCTFDEGIFTTFDSAKAKTIPAKFSDTESRSIVFIDSIDYEKTRARLIANQGSGDIIALMSISGVHFVEQTESGNLIITTVFSVDQGYGFLAVMSRHISNLLADDVMLSQYYGTCEVWE